MATLVHDKKRRKKKEDERFDINPFFECGICSHRDVKILVFSLYMLILKYYIRDEN